jgi:hypothetical protein
MQPVQWRHGFVEASPSRVLRDGEGMLRFKLTHYRTSPPLVCILEVRKLPREQDSATLKMDLAKIILPCRSAGVSPIRRRPTKAPKEPRTGAMGHCPGLSVVLSQFVCSSAKRPFFSVVQCDELLRLVKYPSGCWWALSKSGKGPANL